MCCCICKRWISPFCLEIFADIFRRDSTRSRNLHQPIQRSIDILCKSLPAEKRADLTSKGIRVRPRRRERTVDRIRELIGRYHRPKMAVSERVSGTRDAEAKRRRTARQCLQECHAKTFAS